MRNFALVTCEMIKRAFDCIVVGRTQDLNGLLDSNMRNFSRRFEHSCCPSPAHRWGCGQVLQSHHRRQSAILEMWQVRPLIENNPSDPKGGWNMWGMSWICALVAHWWVSAAAAAVVTSSQRTQQEMKLGVLLWPRNQIESPQWESIFDIQRKWGKSGQTLEYVGGLF